jgi:hypothetical protein
MNFISTLSKITKKIMTNKNILQYSKLLEKNKIANIKKIIECP